MENSLYESHSFRRGRGLCIAQATLEYLVSLLCTGSFLATLTKALGFSDSLTGIISSFISLGCSFQLLSVFIKGRRTKPLVLVMSLMNQLLFTFLYAVPLLPLPGKVKTVLFLLSIFSAYIIYNLAHPKKINWYMSFVEDSHRGIFTANKEIISLISGMVFSCLMGALIDGFTAEGKTHTAFLLAAITLSLLMVAHTVVMTATAPPPKDKTREIKFSDSIKQIFANKALLKVTAVFIIYNIANYAATPFYGIYQINELGLSLTYISIITLAGNLCRIAVSRFWGGYADKKGFARMCEKCFALMAVSFLCAALASPKNGAVLMLFYFIFHSIAMGGINSSLVNMIFDYAPHSLRADALAISQAASGVAGFLATLAVSPVVSLMQAGGNSLFGLTVYPQQVISLFSLVLMGVLILFLRKAVIK
ncbi:MAG: MFS transporter [Clostridia bacterium]|nr:MFS transporter [Clostridia bacterium]